MSIAVATVARPPRRSGSTVGGNATTPSSTVNPCSTKASLSIPPIWISFQNGNFRSIAVARSTTSVRWRSMARLLMPATSVATIGSETAG